MSSITSAGSGLNFTGLASGIDTSSIIEGLTKLNQKRIRELQSKKDDITLHRTVFSTLEGKLVALQAQAGLLARSVGGAFGGRTAASSDATIFTAAASSSAQPGNYTVQVQALAQAQQVASSGVTSDTTTIKQGSVQLQVGAGAVTTVTIDSTNNTLQGLASAINAAGADVRATVINDGSATPFRLLLTSTKSGAANTIQVTNGLTAGDGATLDLTQTTVQAAGDARVTLGSGPGALTVTSANNQVNDLIAGVTVNLAKAAPGQSVTLTIAADTETAGTAVQNFVASYNAVIDYLKSQDSYDATTGEAGTLLGDSNVRALKNDLASTLGASVGGVNARANNLVAIGITFTNDGHLALDDTKLQRALTGQVAGVSATDFRALFGLTGASTSPGVSFVLGGNRVQPTAGGPYQVDVTRAATSAQLTAGTALAPSVVLDVTNNSLQIMLNGLKSSLLTLDPGTYNPTDLATMLQAKINADTALAGSHIVVDLDGGSLRLRSLLTGSASTLSFAGGSALGVSRPLGFTGTETAAGLDVAGQFLVNGQPEVAIGSGQILTGESGNGHTDGLQVRVTLGADQVIDGPDADLTVSQGLASRLSQVLDRYLDPVTGRFKTIDDRYQQSATDIDKSITRQNTMLDAKKSQLVAQFAAMESKISNLQALGNQLAAQFGTINTTAGK